MKAEELRKVYHVSHVAAELESHIENETITEIINQIAPGGEEFTFEFTSIIFFEFWSNNHVQVLLNDISIDDSLTDDDMMAIRGSYEAETAQLYLGFYRH